ncbi:MAG: hypothetical protein KDA83_15280 [Planctomycetales bacterium]|nr:hypothetical protein [Planctomycetales bacterium]
MKLMTLLDLLDWRQPGTEPTGPGEPTVRVEEYASIAFRELTMAERALRPGLVESVEACELGEIYWVKARVDEIEWEKGPGEEEPAISLAVFVQQGEPIGHLLFDRTADDRPPRIDCGEIPGILLANDESIERALESISHDVPNPFLVIHRGPYHYMQTYWIKEDHYVLEYQLVSTKAHYDAGGDVDRQALRSALLAFGNGDDRAWLEQFEWRHIEI